MHQRWMGRKEEERRMKEEEIKEGGLDRRTAEGEQSVCYALFTLTEQLRVADMHLLIEMI